MKRYRIYVDIEYPLGNGERSFWVETDIKKAWKSASHEVRAAIFHNGAYNTEAVICREDCEVLAIVRSASYNPGLLVTR